MSIRQSRSFKPKLDLTQSLSYHHRMERQNDIYNRHERKRRSKRRRTSSEQSARSAQSRDSGLYSARERRATLQEDLSNRPKTAHTPRSKSRSKRMKWTTKAILSVLFLLLFAYLGVLGHTLYQTHLTRQISPAAPPPDAIAEEVLEDIEILPPAGPTPEDDADRFDTLVRQMKRHANVLPRVDRQINREQFEPAIETLETILEDVPHFLDAQLRLADLYIEQKEFAKARDVLHNVIQTDPTRDGVRLRLARALQGLRHYQAALHIALWILEDDAYQEEPNQIAALAYMGLNQVQRSIPHFRRQVAINRDNIVARNNLAVAHARLGDHRQAVALFRDVLAEDPSNAVTYYNLAISLAQQDQGSNAVDVLNDAADRFGLSFVSSWLGSRDFDRIREVPEFVSLQRAVDEEDDLF